MIMGKVFRISKNAKFPSRLVTECGSIALSDLSDNEFPDLECHSAIAIQINANINPCLNLVLD